MSGIPDDPVTRETRADAMRQAAHAYLEVLCGPEDGKLFEIRRDVVTIGRLNDNDVCIPLELSVSRHHARLVRRGDAYVLEIRDEARNPASVRGQAVPPGQTATLQRGETFTLGDVLFELGAGSLCGGEPPTNSAES